MPDDPDAGGPGDMFGEIRLSRDRLLLNMSCKDGLIAFRFMAFNDDDGESSSSFDRGETGLPEGVELLPMPNIDIRRVGRETLLPFGVRGDRGRGFSLSDTAR